MMVIMSRGRQHLERLLLSNNNNNNNNTWRFYLFRSLQLWALLALTSWIIQFLLVARLTSGALHENHSLVHGDHQQQQQQQQPLLSASRTAALVEVQEQHRLRAATEEKEPKHVLSLSSSSSLNEARGKDDQVEVVEEEDKQLEEEVEDEDEQDENENKQGNNANEDGELDENNENAKEEEESGSDNESQWVPKAPQDDDDIVHYNCTNENGKLITLQQVPAFIIIGAQKAGTSAMYDLLNLHPNVQGSREPEAHFFDRRLPIDFLKNPTNTTWADEYRCKVREIYAKKFFPYEQLQNNPHLKFFDKTPAYITSKGAPFRVHAIAPWSKIILSLRNPVHRAFSQHRMEWLPNQPHLTFEERLAVSLDVLKKAGPRYHLPEKDPFSRPSRELMSHNTTMELEKIDGFEIWKSRNLIHRGFYLEQLKPWLEYYTLGKDLLVVRYEEFKSDPEAVLGKIFDFVGVERPPLGTIYNDNVFSQQYGPGRMRGSPGAIAEVPPPAPGSLEFLTQLYKPFNDKLADVLGEEWRGVWD